MELPKIKIPLPKSDPNSLVVGQDFWDLLTEKVPENRLESLGAFSSLQVFGFYIVLDKHLPRDRIIGLGKEAAAFVKDLKEYLEDKDDGREKTDKGRGLASADE